MPYYKRKREEIVAQKYDGTNDSFIAINTLMQNIGGSATKVDGTTNLLISGSFGKFMLIVSENLVIDEARGASKMSDEELNNNWEV